MFLTMSTIFRATLFTLDKLQMVCDQILTEERLRLSEASSNHIDRCKEQNAFRVLSQRCRSYMNSVEIMQNRAGKLIELVSILWNT